MSKFLIQFEASIGRKKADISVDDPGASLLNPIDLTFFGIVEAKDSEEVNDKIVLYTDPGFKTRVVNIAELGKGMSTEELYDLMAFAKIIKST
jgi:hypothetical protein